MKPGSYRLAFIAACIADITACSAVTPVDDYMTTHNLYGNLCREVMEQSEDWECSETNIETPAGDDLKLNEGSIQNEQEKDEDQEEAL